jgi:predicted DNA binding CopG/RHH family protein
MPKLPPDEAQILTDFDSGRLRSVATPPALERLRAAARATQNKNRRINLRIPAQDLQNLQARALAEGIPYQTLIASIIHKYVTGQLHPQPGPEPARAPVNTIAPPSPRPPKPRA